MALFPKTLLLLGLAFTLGVEINSDYADDIPDIADEVHTSEKVLEADTDVGDESEEGVGLRYHHRRPTYTAPARAACFTINGNQCKSRFTYKGRTFNQCTTYNSENNQPWCESVYGQYEDCQRSCTFTREVSYSDSCYSNGKTYSHGKRWYVGCNTYSCNNGKVSRTNKICSSKPKTSYCKCINPFSGYNFHSGDPDVTCNRDYNPFCYVDAHSTCSDKRPARGGGRYYSRVACDKNLRRYGSW